MFFNKNKGYVHSEVGRHSLPLKTAGQVFGWQFVSLTRQCNRITIKRKLNFCPE